MMKSPILIFLILSELLTLIFIRNFRSEKAILDIKTLPSLYVDGNFIKRSNNNQKVILKGVTTQIFGYHSYPTEKFWKLFYQVKSWGINLIGVFITPETIQNKLDNLDLLVKKTEENHIYLYLTPTLDGRIKNPLLYAKDFPKFIGNMAKRYKDKKHIFYGVWAEPHNISWSDYLKMVKETIFEVRKNNPKAIIVVNGIDWGAQFYNTDDFSSLENIILNYHYYPASNKNELKKILKSDEKLPWQSIINKFPVLIGEFGGVWETDFGSEEDLKFLKKVLKNINENRLNYTTYTLDNEGEISLFDHSTFLPTRKGEVVKEDLRTQPPTRFFP